MYYTLIIILSFIIFGSSIDGAPSTVPPLIVDDVERLGVSLEQFWFVASNNISHEAEKKCPILTKCCSGKKFSKALSVLARNFSDEPFDTTFAACLGSSIPSKAAKTCPQILKLNSSSSSSTHFGKDIDYTDKTDPFVVIIVHARRPIEDFLKNIARVCNENEVLGFLCLTDENLFKSCITKVLQHQFKIRGKKTYQKYVQQLETALNDMNDLLELFEEN